MNYESDNPATEKVLREIETMIITHGGQLCSDATVVVKHGDLRIHNTRLAASSQKLIDIPEACLPAVEKFRLGIENDMIVIRGHDKEILDSHLQTLDKMIELYNLCDKVRFQKRTSLWFALDDYPGLLEMLLAARAGNSNFERLQKLRRDGNHDQLIWESFLRSRWFTLDSNRYGKTVKVIFPFIEFMNHHSAASGFQVSEGANSEQSVGVYNSQPEPDSNECFVCYNLLDPLDTLLGYGYVDRGSPVLRSVPMEMTLSNGIRIDIAGMNAAPHDGTFPEHIDDLRAFMPRILSHDQGRTVISHLIVPGAGAPYALQRVLAELLRNIRPTMGDTIISELVHEAESFVIAENDKYYDSLTDKILEVRKAGEKADSLDLIDQLIVCQKLWLNAYRQRIDSLSSPGKEPKHG